MDRRIRRLIAAAVAVATPIACHGARAPRLAADAGLLAFPTRELHAASTLDASLVDAEPIGLLQGAQAEQAIGGQVAPAAAPVPAEPGLPPFEIQPGSVGPFRLGMSHAELASALPPGAPFVKLPVAPGKPTLEQATLPGLVTATLLAGRVVELDVFGQDPRAVTDRELGVGATLEQVIDAHGDVRVSSDGRGWVASDLPGVLFVPGDPTWVAISPPPPLATIRHIIVVGPEAD